MNPEPSLTFKIASEDWEIEAIHRLNYKTFVEEIPQHQKNAEQRLVDKFHAENTYAICLHGNQLVGMVTGRARRPFSLDQKVPNDFVIQHRERVAVIVIRHDFTRHTVTLALLHRRHYRGIQLPIALGILHDRLAQLLGEEFRRHA